MKDLTAIDVSSIERQSLIGTMVRAETRFWTRTALFVQRQEVIYTTKRSKLE